MGTIISLLFLILGFYLIYLLIKKIRNNNVVSTKIVYVLFMLFPLFMIYITSSIVYQNLFIETKVSVSDELNQIYNGCDYNNDGVLNLNNYLEKEYHMIGFKYAIDVSNILNKANSNLDTIVTYDELKNYITKFDVNRDGFLNKEQAGIDAFLKKPYILEYQNYNMK